MEENKKFRNHISIIFERVGSGFWVIAGFLLFEVLSDPELLRDFESAGESRWIVFAVLGGFLAVAAILLGIQFFLWSKTYISIEENTIVFEKNTLKREKKTIGLQHISNINTEQNLFEILVGTCKVKMDTDSFSTADSTDLTIVLKKKDAEAFQEFILGKMNQQVKEAEPTGRKEDKTGAGMEEMLTHGFYSIRFISVGIAILSLVGLAGMIGTLFSDGMDGLGMLSQILILGLFTCSVLWSIGKEFFQYYGFYVERIGNHLHIQYGLLKKVDYRIPVDRINAVRFIQTPHARLLNRYTAELINVGMGDNEEEEQSFFLMYDKKEKIASEMKRLLPEFSPCLDLTFVKQPSDVWKIWLVSKVFFLGILLVIYGVVAEFFAKYLTIAGVLLLLVFLWSFVAQVFGYKTEGNVMTEDFIGICQGTFGREKIFVRFDKIQYIESKQNILAKHYKMAKAEIHLLASAMKSLHEIPYYPEGMTEELKERILGR